MQICKNSLFVPVVCLPLFAGACQLSEPTDESVAAISMKGRAGAMPAFYDDVELTVNMKEMPDAASASLIANNKSINQIFAYADLDEEQPFIPVIDAIQGDGFNPLWQQFLIVFNDGCMPRQLTSDTEVFAAEASGEITLVDTQEVYRCAVIGPKK
jgi:hypothetical protein